MKGNIKLKIKSLSSESIPHHNIRFKSNFPLASMCLNFTSLPVKCVVFFYCSDQTKSAAASQWKQDLVRSLFFLCAWVFGVNVSLNSCIAQSVTLGRTGELPIGTNPVLIHNPPRGPHQDP